MSVEGARMQALRADLEQAEERLKDASALVSEALLEVWRHNTDKAAGDLDTSWVEGRLHEAVGKHGLTLNSIRRARRNL